MQENFKVAIQVNNECGYIEYDHAEKLIKVVFDDSAIRQKIESYLSTEHVIRVAGEGLLDFKDVTVRPAENVELFKTALTRMWGKIGVHVDWSRPVA